MSSTLQILMYCAIFIGLMMLGYFVLRWCKARYDPRGGTTTEPAGMSLEEMENLHEKGLISDEEFQRLRRVALGIDPARPEKSSIPDQPDDIMLHSGDETNQSGSTNHKDKGT
jgi:hypothetical protein